jgi:hypothetical protein
LAARKQKDGALATARTPFSLLPSKFDSFEVKVLFTA